MSAYSDRVLADGATAYWRLNETSGTAAVDSAGTRHGTISGGVVLNQAGRVAGATAMVFPADGLGKVVPSAFPGLGSAFTVELWCQPSTAVATAHRHLLGKSIAVDGECQWHIVANAAVLRFHYYSGAYQDYDVASMAWTVGVWTHIVLVGGSGQTTLYVDGVAQTGKAMTLAGAGGVHGIGCTTEVGAETWGWRGGLSDVAVYPRALTPAEIAAHHTVGITPEGPPVEPPPLGPYATRVMADGASNYWRLGETSGLTAVDIVGGKDGTISGGVTLGASGAIADGTPAMAFNGTTGQIVTPTLTIPLACTIEVWFKTGTSIPSYNAFFSNRTATIESSLFFGVNAEKLVVYCSPTSFDCPTVVTDNRWHHVVLVSNGTLATMYLDGQLELSGPLPRLAFTHPVAIGHDIQGNGHWPGLVDDIAIYPRALSAAEVQAHYDLGKIPMPTNYPDRVVWDGASHYWRLNDTGSTAIDIVSGANGTISGGVIKGAPGAVANGDAAMRFDGVDDKIVTTAVTLPVVSTVEVWMKATSAAFRYYFQMSGLSMGIGQNNGEKPFLYDGSVKYGNRNMNDGLWHHVAWVFTGTTATVYVDGVLDGSGAQVFAAPITGAVSISAPDGFWNGALDDIAIYPRALSAAEIASHFTLARYPAGPMDLNTALYTYLLGVFGLSSATSYAERVRADGATNHWRLGETAGTVAVDAIGGANGTISGGVTLNQPSVMADGDTAMTFNGTTGVVNHPDLAIGTTCTIELWVKPSVAGAAYTGLIGSFGGGVSVYYQTNKVNCFTTGDNLNLTPLALGVWSHVVIAINAGSGTFYVNGVADGTFASWPGKTFNAFGGTGTSKFTGGMDDISIYPRALTAAEIAAHYSLGKSAMSGGNDLTTLITRYLATLSGDMTARWKQMEKNAGF